MIGKSKPAIHFIENEARLKDFDDGSAKIVCLAFLNDDYDNEDLRNMISEVAESRSDVHFGLALPALASMYGAKAGDFAVITRFGDVITKILPITSATAMEDILKFVSIYAKELITPFSQENFQNIMRSPLKFVTLIFTSTDDSVTIPILNEPAEALVEDVVHVSVVADEETNVVFEHFKIKPNDAPALIAFYTTNFKYIKYEGDFNSADIEQWERKVVEGVIKPTLRSEEPEAGDLKGSVKEVRGKTFDSIVINNDKNVLLMIYASWCGHCKDFLPTFMQIGERLASSSDIIVAKMDGDTNDIEYPGVQIEHFPTLYYFTGKEGENKQAVLYEDEALDIDNIVLFTENFKDGVGRDTDDGIKRDTNDDKQGDEL